MEIMDVRQIIVSFFIMLKEDTYVLIRIQALVSLVTTLFLVMIILDFFRCRNRSSLLTTIFQTVDSASDRLVLYLLGSMQAASFENQMFPVWAVVLVSLRASLGYLSGYGIQDEHRRLTEFGNVLKFMAAGVLNHTRGLKFSKPLWSLWAILLARNMYRFLAHHQAIGSLWHGRNTEFLPEYMRYGAHRDPKESNPHSEEGNGGHEQGNRYREEGNPHSEEGSRDCEQGNRDREEGNSDLEQGSRDCEQGNRDREEGNSDLEQGSRDCEQGNGEHKQGNGDQARTDNDGNTHAFLVCGESEQNVQPRKPMYTLQLEVVNIDALITVEKISASDVLQSSTEEFRGRYKDMSLAFALSRLLRCRFEDVTLETESIQRTRNLIISKIIESQETVAASEETGSTNCCWRRAAPMTAVDAETEEGKRAFKILELELGFTRDYFHSLYPLVFWWGLGSLLCSLLLSAATFGVALWLAVDIRGVFHQARDEKNFMLQMHGGMNIDVLITWLFMFFMMSKEIWEITSYLMSDWTRLLLVCKYVQEKIWFWKLLLKERVIKSFYRDCKLAGAWHGSMDQYDFLQSCDYKPFLRQAANVISLGKIKGIADGKKTCKAINVPECVKPAILQALRRIVLNNIQLPREIPSLRGGGSVQRFQRYSWACLELNTCSQVILVWHIATSLCEIKLAEDCGIDLTKPSFLRSAWSRLKTFSCFTSQPYLVKKNDSLQGQHQNNYHIATSLSRYCAYLQGFRSQLLPDSFFVPNLIFEQTLEHARKILKDCNLEKCRYNKLMTAADEAKQSNLDMKLNMNIVQQGATLAKVLIEEEDSENRWKIIAEVWADLLVQIAPSWNAAEHKYCLESGGEFITLIWVLLTHCGIHKSRLWDEIPRGNTNNEIGNNLSLEISQVHHGNNTGQSSSIQAGNGQQVSESGAQVHQENNAAQPSNFRSVDEQPVSESRGQVHQENKTDQTSNAQAVDQQQVPKSSGQVLQENNTETINTEIIKKQPNEDEIEIDADYDTCNLK